VQFTFFKKQGIKKSFIAVKTVLILLFQLFLLGTIVFRVVPIPLTPLMVIRPTAIQKDWVSYKSINPNVPIAAMTAEDPFFPEHNGFDFKAMEKAVKDNADGKKMLRGGSTISQQTAKNVFLFPGSGYTRYIRKAFEFPLTAWLELMWSKRRIMEVYLNIIEMGDGIYGIEAAAQKYFKKSASKLTANEAATIVVCFPNPLKRNPLRLTPRLVRKRNRIVRWMRGYKLPQNLQP
jgi:monofunctional biosynthetic peptidoglycan transglycosylase